MNLSYSEATEQRRTRRNRMRRAKENAAFDETLGRSWRAKQAPRARPAAALSNSRSVAKLTELGPRTGFLASRGDPGYSSAAAPVLHRLARIRGAYYETVWTIAEPSRVNKQLRAADGDRQVPDRADDSFARKVRRMAYLKPDSFTKSVFNPLAMRFRIGGAATLAVQGRRSGRSQTVPVIPVELGGAQYLVSTRGDSEWVRNLRAAGGRGELRQKGAVQKFQAEEVPVSDRAEIIAAYRTAAGRAVASYFASLPDPADHPTFRLKPSAT
jgi:deazaflavin-dependent oxidoreductase (nitroreductase family)